MTSVVRLFRRLAWVVVALAVFVWELILANLRVAREVLTPGIQATPAIIRVPTATRTDLETMLLANMITMTPGTLSLEVDRAARVLYVHTLYFRDHESALAGISKLERILLKVTR